MTEEAFHFVISFPFDKVNPAKAAFVEVLHIVIVGVFARELPNIRHVSRDEAMLAMVYTSGRSFR